MSIIANRTDIRNDCRERRRIQMITKKGATKYVLVTGHTVNHEPSKLAFTRRKAKVKIIIKEERMTGAKPERGVIYV